uniref:Uncharacterized protein n=1 Tax=Anguilla anguilla TaxID=7936 RepID=A0A0E9PM23_ANGAN
MCVSTTRRRSRRSGKKLQEDDAEHQNAVNEGKHVQNGVTKEKHL